MTDCVDPAMNAVEPAGACSVHHLVLREPKCIKLGGADHSVLTFRQLGDSSSGVDGAFFGYMTSKSPSALNNPGLKEKQA